MHICIASTRAEEAGHGRWKQEASALLSHHHVGTRAHLHKSDTPASERTPDMRPRALGALWTQRQTKLLARCAFSTSAPASRVSPRIGTSRVSQSSTAAAYHRQRRTEWIIVGVAGSAAAFGGWYYWMNMRGRGDISRDFSSLSGASASGRTASSFTIPARHNSGHVAHKVITPLTPAEVDVRLRENEQSVLVDRPLGACLVARYDTNSIASNSPSEDRHAEIIVERDRGVDEKRRRRSGSGEEPEPERVRGDLCFFTVMDGHGGDFTSTLLSQKLIAFVALELDKVFRETGEYVKAAHPYTSMWRSLFGDAHASNALDGNPDVIKRALTKGFRGLDKEIITTPLELLKQYELSLAARPKSSNENRSLSSLANTIWTSSPTAAPSPFPTVSRANAFESMLPAISGSCALMLYVDSARRDLYVASTGDSRAVAGYWNEREGRWEVEALSIDQTGRNPDEVRRLQREHPGETPVFRGRVLGGLEPTRAFGDGRYKWDTATQWRLYDAFVPGGRAAARVPRNLNKPPYVTAEPVVEWRHVPGGSETPSDSFSAAAEGLKSTLSSSSSRELRFIVLATDGLWDLLSNEEAVGLVAGHLAGVQGTVRASDLQRMCFEPARGPAPPKTKPAPPGAPPTPPPTPPAKAPADIDNGSHHPLMRSPNHLQTFTFQDDNLSTHLVRNALGGAARDRVAGLLAIPAPESRRYRDDITVNVILFHAPRSAAPETGEGTPATPPPTPPPAAKL